MQVVGPIGGDDGHPLGPQPGQQEREQVAGGLVGPVQILDHQQQGRADLGRVAERAGDGVEQLQPGRVVVGGRRRGGSARPGDQPVERRPVTQRLGQRPVLAGAVGQLTQRLGER